MRCIWKIAEEDRLCQYCVWWGGCETRPLTLKSAPEEYVGAMNEMMGFDITARDRHLEYTYARYMVAYLMFKDGFSHPEIAKALRRDRATVVHALSVWRSVLEMPRAYQKEIEIYNKYVTFIKNQQDELKTENSEVLVLQSEESGSSER